MFNFKKRFSAYVKTKKLCLEHEMGLESSASIQLNIVATTVQYSAVELVHICQESDT